MGCFGSKALLHGGKQRDEISLQYRDVRQSLALTDDELWKLYTLFSRCNRDESGSVKVDEFMRFFNLDSGPFAIRVYKIFKDTKEGITFKNFCICLWTICTRDRENLVNFAFQLYDVQGRGELGLADVRLLLSELYGADYEENDSAVEVMHMLVRYDHKDRAIDAHVTLADFARMVKSRSLVLFLAFELQRRMQERTFGTRTWDAITKRRDKLIENGEFEIGRIVELVNTGRSRRGSVVNVTDRHIMGVVAARGVNNVAGLGGLKRGNRVKPEEDYFDKSGVQSRWEQTGIKVPETLKDTEKAREAIMNAADEVKSFIKGEPSARRQSIIAANALAGASKPRRVSVAEQNAAIETEAGKDVVSAARSNAAGGNDSNVSTDQQRKVRAEVERLAVEQASRVKENKERRRRESMSNPHSNNYAEDPLTKDHTPKSSFYEAIDDDVNRVDDVDVAPWASSRDQKKSKRMNSINVDAESAEIRTSLLTGGGVVVARRSSVAGSQFVYQNQTPVQENTVSTSAYSAAKLFDFSGNANAYLNSSNSSGHGMRSNSKDYDGKLKYASSQHSIHSTKSFMDEEYGNVHEHGSHGHSLNQQHYSRKFASSRAGENGSSTKSLKHTLSQSVDGRSRTLSGAVGSSARRIDVPYELNSPTSGNSQGKNSLLLPIQDYDQQPPAQPREAWAERNAIQKKQDLKASIAEDSRRRREEAQRRADKKLQSAAYAKVVRKM